MPDVTQLNAPLPRRSRTRSLRRSYVLALGLVAAVTIGATALILAAATNSAPVTQLRHIAVGFCVTMFGVLLFEAFLVFVPAARAIDALLLDHESVKHELYAKAEQMHNDAKQQERQNGTLQAQQHSLLEQQEELMAQQATLIEHRDHLELRTSELSRLTAILDATPDAVAVFSLTGDVLYTNAVAEQHLQQVRKRDWTHAAHLLSPASVRQLRDAGFPRAIRKGLWQGEATLRSRGGPERTVVQTLLAHRGADGRVSMISVMLQDITEQKMLQQQLAEGESRNRAIIDALAEGIVVQDDAGQIIAWNSSAERILGMTGDQLSGKTSADPGWKSVDARGDELRGEDHPISRARIHGVSIDDEVMAVHRGDGSRVWLSVTARPMQRTGDASAPAAVATFSDITQARLIAREIETLSVVARQSDHAIVTTDAAGLLTWTNPAWERLTGFSPAEALGKHPGTLLQGTHTSTETSAQMRDAIRAGRSWNGEILNYRRDGAPYWIEMSITPTLDAAAVLTGFVGLSRDISSRRNADRERQQLAAAVAVTADGIAITGVSGALEFVNHAFARMHGYKAPDLLQISWSTLYERDEAKRLLRDAIPEVTQVGFWHGESTGLRSDGSRYPQELSLTLLPHGGLVAVARDISDRKAAEERLLHLSVRDELTSLFNRRGFLERAELALKLAIRQGVPCALLYGDLDSFKSVNDNFGHDAGDSALRTIAMILKTSFRDTDLIARLGGDEFTILAIDVRPDDVTAIIDRIEDAIARSNERRSVDPAQAWRLGISLGVAAFDPASPLDVELLLRRADEAQYERKRERKARAAAAGFSAPAGRA
jgi:diguanylate cyclase (GGDEF)-like protein/PAS domain S-box-containing protein